MPTTNEAPSPPHYTDAQREYMYDRGEYVFNVPPVTHAAWSKRMWINYIGDAGWRPSKETLSKFQAASLTTSILEVLFGARR